MQDLTSAIKALNDAAASANLKGWLFIVCFIAILAYLLLKPLLSHPRKPTQEMHLNLAGVKENGGPGGMKVCALHSGVDAKLEKFSEYHEEDKREFEKISEKLDGLAKSITDSTATALDAANHATAAALAASTAATNAALAASNAAYHREYKATENHGVRP